MVFLYVTNIEVTKLNQDQESHCLVLLCFQDLFPSVMFSACMQHQFTTQHDFTVRISPSWNLSLSRFRTLRGFRKAHSTPLSLIRFAKTQQLLKRELSHPRSGWPPTTPSKDAFVFCFPQWKRWWVVVTLPKWASRRPYRYPPSWAASPVTIHCVSVV